MSCPRANGTDCRGIDCPMFCPPADNCLEVLVLKDKLNVLSIREKQALTILRRSSMVSKTGMPKNNSL